MAFTASASMSRLLSLSTAAAAAASTTRATTITAAFPTSKLSPSSLIPSFSLLPLKPKTLPKTLRFSSTATPPISASISVGSKLPDATFSYFDAADELQTTTVADLTKSKKAIFFAVPGAFTPTCSQKHLPGFVEKSGELKAKGVDVIACISVNDAFVMKAWKKDLNINDEVLLLSDGNGDFTRAIGAELDLRDKPVGLGVRSRRYAMLVEDGVAKVLNMEEGGAFTFSGAEDMLKVL